MSITFEFQKKEVRNDTISHQRSGDSLGKGEMCPIRAAAVIVKEIASYKQDSPRFANNPNKLSGNWRKGLYYPIFINPVEN